MDKTLDMTLDDLIKSRKSSSRGRGRGVPRGGRGGRGSFGGRRMVGSGPTRLPQGPLRVNARASAFTIAKSFRRTNIPRQHDLIEDSLAAVGLPGIQDGSKLHVSNLDHGVSNDDIRELFSEIGELKRYAIHYDKNGLPTGSAEVVYTRRSDAFAAIKRYNNVRLDGRPMKIEIMNPKSELPVSARINVIGGVNGASTRRVVTTQSRGRPMPMVPPANRGAFQRARGGMRNMRGRGRGRGQSQGRGHGVGRGRGRGRGRKQPKEKSAEELDNELDNYHAEAMETS